jgi:hypothetical protein
MVRQIKIKKKISKHKEHKKANLSIELVLMER